MSASAEAHELALRGDFTRLDAIVREFEHDETPHARAWSLALRSLQFMAVPTGATPWQPEVVAAWGGNEDTRSPAVLICAQAERHALLTFDVEALRAWCRVHETLEADDAPYRGAARLWLAIAEGRFEAAAAEARSVEIAAGHAGRGALVVDAAAARAWALLAMRALDEATSVSRRASRMARTEAFPQSEYLAHLVLARVRRAAGHPHLATRILAALAKVASPVWRPWLRIELALSGALETAQSLVVSDAPPADRLATELALSGALETAQSLVVSNATPADRLANELVTMFEAVEGADRAAFDAAASALTSQSIWPTLGVEVRELVAVLDPERQPIGSCVAWCRGTTDDAPAILSGLLTRAGSAPADDSAMAYVVARPSDRRRLPRLAFGLSSRLGLTVLRQSRRKQGRVEMLISLLAFELGEDGVDEVQCFRRIYGFEYEVEVHKGVFDVLVHRAREYLDDAGRITRGGGRIGLELTRSLLVADPRCTKPLPDSLLRIIAQQHGATPKEVAAAAGVSLRAAQAALHDLAEAGACEAQRHGRAVQYVVEDTTFSEPTNRVENTRGVVPKSAGPRSAS